MTTKKIYDTVDGRNPAPPSDYGKPLFIGKNRGIIIPGFLRWCRILSIHTVCPTFSGESDQIRAFERNMVMGQNPNRTPSEHPNPTTKIGSEMGGEFTYPSNGIPWVLTTTAICLSTRQLFGWISPGLGHGGASGGEGSGAIPRAPARGEAGHQLDELPHSYAVPKLRD